VSGTNDGLVRQLGTNGTIRLFTPIPKRVMNGSEEGDVVPAAVLSGAPIELQARTVRYVLNKLSRFNDISSQN
jgi:hypothetical protein